MLSYDRDCFGEAAMNCMTVISGKAASATGRVLVAHNEDDSDRIAVRHHWVPAADWPAGSLLPAEPGCARIPQVSHTLGYYWMEFKRAAGGLSTADSFVNECGVIICTNSMGTSREPEENTAGLREGGIVFSLRRALAERATSAREGARILMDLVDTWGYASSGRAYTIADKDEAFQFQLVRGKHYLGARVPDDAVVVMPNHYTLHSLTDCPEMFYPADLVSYAAEQGWYDPAEGPFDFARAYQAAENDHNPRNVMRQMHGTRIVLGRDWNVETEGLPFCVKAEKPVDLPCLAAVMMSHYEGTPDCCEFTGPGRAPHYAPNQRYICTGTTLESCLYDPGEDPLHTVVYTALGRPGELPYLALHPLAGLPAALASGLDAAEAAYTHLSPEPFAACRQQEDWQRFRDVETLADLTYCETNAALRRLNDRLFAEALTDAQALAGAPAAQLAVYDEAALQRALSLLEAQALTFPTATVEAPAPLSLAALPQDFRLTFRAAGEVIPEEMCFGLAHTHMRRSFAPLLPDTLRRLPDGRYEAAFDLTLTAANLGGPGCCDFALGGRTADGRPFAALVLLQLTA